MGKQKRGCSRLYYALYNYDTTTGEITFGTPKKLAEVKSISKTVNQASEGVFADNKKLYDVYGASEATRSFEVVEVSKEIEAELMGQSVLKIGDKILTGTAQDGTTKPFVAIGYALHDGDKNRPCEVVWAFKAQVQSISSEAATIDNGTASNPQTIEVNFYDPDATWEATGKADLDITLAITPDNASDVDKWFAQVVTYDNATTVLAA